MRRRWGLRWKRICGWIGCGPKFRCVCCGHRIRAGHVRDGAARWDYGCWNASEAFRDRIRVLEAQVTELEGAVGRAARQLAAAEMQYRQLLYKVRMGDRV